MWVAMTMIAGVVVSGCSRSEKVELYPAPFGVIPTPQPPPFLNGPMAVLLTNVGGFSARVRLVPAVAASSDEIVSGHLLGRGSSLLFAPDSKPGEKKHPMSGGITYLWDVARNSGYILSEPMQAWAPWSSSVRFTNLTAQPGESSRAEKIEGRLCVEQEVVVVSDSGSNSRLRVWRATDASGFPLRIVTGTNLAGVALSISKLNLAPAPADVFALPSGFTRYGSVEAMMTELALRQQNLRRPSGVEWGERDITPSRESRPAGPER